MSKTKYKRGEPRGFKRGVSNKTHNELEILAAGYGVRAENKYIRCGKAMCKKCSDGLGHGPYIYLRCYNTGSGSTTPIYLGPDNVKNRKIIDDMRGHKFENVDSMKEYIKILKNNN